MDQKLKEEKINELFNLLNSKDEIPMGAFKMMLNLSEFIENLYLKGYNDCLKMNDEIKTNLN